MKIANLLNQESGGNVTLLTIAGLILVAAGQLFTAAAGELGPELYAAMGLTVLAMVVLLIRVWWMKTYGTEPVNINVDAVKLQLKTYLITSISVVTTIIVTAELMGLPADKIEILKKQKTLLEELLKTYFPEG